MTTRRIEHEDYAEEAESAERASAWPQAAALWRRAGETCDDAEQHATYEANMARCNGEIAVDEELATIARRRLGIPTLAYRNMDDLDFHEVSVGGLLDALRAAYRAGRNA